MSQEGRIELGGSDIFSWLWSKDEEERQPDVKIRKLHNTSNELTDLNTRRTYKD